MEDVDDEDFFLQVAAIEADALSHNKRRKTTTTPGAAAEKAEGVYMAALKGSKSHLFQQQQLRSSSKTDSNIAKSTTTTTRVLVGDENSGGACFKCGKSGHWARDCGEEGEGGNEKECPCGIGLCLVRTAKTERNLGRKFYKCPQENGGCGFFEWCDKSLGSDNLSIRSQNYNVIPSVPELSYPRDCDGNGGGDVLVADKVCPCGVGVCLVRTAKTVTNSGRKFYKCPQENGGCGFFEWCDKSPGSDNLPIRSQNYSVNPSVPELSCPCGAGSCVTLTAKTGNNIGQQFYRCPSGQSGCGFFKWCNEHTVAAVHSDSLNISTSQKISYEASNKNHGTIGSSCFKCGKDGHWARDCSNQTSFQSPVNSGRKVDSSNTCFKCGKPGHWAKDCSSQI